VLSADGRSSGNITKTALKLEDDENLQSRRTLSKEALEVFIDEDTSTWNY